MHTTATHRRRLAPPRAGLLTILGIACGLFAQPGDGAEIAPPSRPGFVAGERPEGIDGPVVEVAGGWMVPYEETIPGTDTSFRMVPIPGGSFRMGSPESEADRESVEGPCFEVTLEPFWMSAKEVSWAEYKRYMAAYNLFNAMAMAKIREVNSENEADAVTAPSELYDPTTTYINGEEPELPAVTMTQFAARQYTCWLSRLTGRFYRIPSEAEWEYACRAGSSTPWNTGDDPEALAAAAWFADTSDDTTHPVGSLEPNAWGLYDMHGNAAEWVVDQLSADGYARQAALAQPVPEAAAIAWPTELEGRIVRGGAYYDDADRCRSAARRGSEDEAWKDVDPNLPKSPWWYTEEPALGVGMRLVRPLDPPDEAEQKRWWEADIESIRYDVTDRVSQGRGALGIVDPELPAELKAEGLIE